MVIKPSLSFSFSRLKSFLFFLKLTMIGLVFKLCNHFYPLKHWGSAGRGTKIGSHMPASNRLFPCSVVHRIGSNSTQSQIWHVSTTEVITLQMQSYADIITKTFGLLTFSLLHLVPTPFTHQPGFTLHY